MRLFNGLLTSLFSRSTMPVDPLPPATGCVILIPVNFVNELNVAHVALINKL